VHSVPCASCSTANLCWLFCVLFFLNEINENENERELYWNLEAGKIWQVWKLNGLDVNAQLTRWSVSFAELSCQYYLCSMDISEQQAWKLWIHFSYLTLPLHGTPVNNFIKLISPVTIHFCCWQYMHQHRSANFTTVLSANPLDAEPETDFNAK